LDRTIVAEVFQHGEITRYNQGQIIYKGGSALDRFYVVVDGVVEVFDESLDTKNCGQDYLKASGYFWI
jgi:CRP-like cAMP-binding protein